MKQSGPWSSLDTHGSLVVMWWLCIPCSGETGNLDLLSPRTYGHTDTQAQATTIPEGQNWPRVKISASVDHCLNMPLLAWHVVGRISESTVAVICGNPAPPGFRWTVNYVSVIGFAFLLASLLTNRNYLTWFLIGWKQSCKPIRIYVAIH